MIKNCYAIENVASKASSKCEKSCKFVYYDNHHRFKCISTIEQSIKSEVVIGVKLIHAKSNLFRHRQLYKNTRNSGKFQWKGLLISLRFDSVKVFHFHLYLQ